MTYVTVSEAVLRESELCPQNRTTNNVVNESSKIQRLNSIQKQNCWKSTVMFLGFF